MPLTVERVAETLRAAGLRRGDVVFFHTRLRGLADEAEQRTLPHFGADVVIDGFLDVLGPEGVLACPTHSYGACIDPATGQSELVYDRATTPSCVGLTTNVLRRRPGAVRSEHPTHSVAALGGRAAELVAGHQTGCPYELHGPHGKVVAWGGKVCWFNTTAKTHTLAHFVEHWMHLPYLQVRDAWACGPDGAPVKVHMTGCSHGARDFYREDSKLARAMADSGLLTEAPFAAATITLMDAAATCEFLCEAIIAEPLLLLPDDRPDDEWVQRARRITPPYIRRRFPGGRIEMPPIG